MMAYDTWLKDELGNNVIMVNRLNACEQLNAIPKDEVVDIVTNILLDVSKINNPYKADHNDLLTLSKHNGFVDAKAIILDMLEEKIDELRGNTDGSN